MEEKAKNLYFIDHGQVSSCKRGMQWSIHACDRIYNQSKITN